ncbi:MAG: hypothetical protein GY785_14725 [Gammaproteobacteria bacterium]|nr:hypothetical protein [Gammaproteobacteria bacterium]
MIELERVHAPGLIDLLRPLSLAIRAELELVRAMRLRLLPRSDPGLEADLWSSPLLQARDVSAVVLSPEARYVLHLELQQNPAELAMAWQVVADHHRHLDPVILREELTTYLALRGDFEQAERQLGPVIQALRDSPQDRELKRWVRRFIDRLPAGTRDSAAAKVLRKEESQRPTVSSLQQLEIGIRRVPEGLWITCPPEPRALSISVPQRGAPHQQAAGLTVAWPETLGWSERTVALAASAGAVDTDSGDFAAEPSFLPTPAGRLLLRTIEQRELELRPDGERPLLYILLDDLLPELPAVLRDQLDDLAWRHEIVRMNESRQRTGALVWIGDYVSPKEWPIDQLIEHLNALGFDTRRADRDVQPAADVEAEIGGAGAAVVVFGDGAVGSGALRHEFELLLKRKKGDPAFVVIPVPVSREALAAVNEAKLRDRLLFETQMVTPGPFEEQMDQISGSLEKALEGQLPRDWRGGTRVGNAEADATLLYFAEGDRLRSFLGSLADGFGDRIDLDWAIAHRQSLLVLTDYAAGRLHIDEVNPDASAKELAEGLRNVPLGPVLDVDRNPAEQRRRLRGALLEIERKREEERIRRYLEGRYQLTPEEQELLRQVQVTIDGRPGFIVAGRLAVIQREPERDPPERATAVIGEVALRSAKAKRLRFDGNFAVYEFQAPDDIESILELTTVPVQIEDRCYATLWSGQGAMQVAGLVREPDFGDIPGTPHALAFRLPSDNTVESSEQVFGPLVHDRKLIGVVYSVTPGADFGGEGDLAYALPIDRLQSVLEPLQRAARIDRRAIRPGGDWAPAVESIEIGGRDPERPQSHNRQWLFSEFDSGADAQRYQLEALWSETAEEPDTVVVKAHKAIFFPPNDCTEVLEKILAEQADLQDSKQDGISADALGRWLDQSPALSPATVAELEVLGNELSEGRGPVRRGLRWVLRGVAPEMMSEGPSESVTNGTSTTGEENAAADQRAHIGHRGTVRSLALTPDGSRALTAGNSHPDQMVKIWDLRRGRLLHTLDEQAESGGRTALAISADGERMITTYLEELRLWDVESGEIMMSMKADVRPPWLDACFAGSHHVLATVGDQTFLFELDSGAGQPLGTGGGEHLAVAASEGGRLLAVRRRDGITVWRREKGKLEIIDSIELPLTGDMYQFQRPALRFTAAERLIFGSPQREWMEEAGTQPLKSQELDNIADLDRHGAALWAPAHHTMQVIDAFGEPLTPELQCDEREVACAALAADGVTLIAADFDHHLWVWWLGEPRMPDTPAVE